MTLLSHPAWCLDPALDIDQFHHTAWSVEEGAPADIWALAQGPDGYLWLGTGMGLYRFDGVRFERFAPPAGQPFRSNNLTALLFDPSGALWIGFYFGGSSVLQNGRLTHYTEADGMPAGAVYQFARDTDGMLWAATKGGLARFDGAHWERIGPERAYPAGAAEAVIVDDAGTLWVATGDAVVARPAGSNRFEDTGVRLGPNAVFARAPDGAIWVSDEPGGTRVLSAHAGSAPAKSEAGATSRPLPRQAKRFLFDRDGSLWASDAVRGGVFRARNPGSFPDADAPPGAEAIEAFTKDQGLTADIAVPLFEDREGNIWVGTNLGLNRFRHRNVAIERGIPSTSAFGFALARGLDGEVWITDTGRLYRVARNRLDIAADSLPKITSAYSAADGTLWLGGPAGLRRWVEGRWWKLPLPAAVRETDIQALTADLAGDLWISFDGRDVVYRLSGELWEPFGGIPELPRLMALSAATDRAGRVWFGYTENRIARLDRGGVTVFSARNGLAVGNVATVHVHDDRVLAGGENGVALLQGSAFGSITADRVAEFSNVSGIVATDSGDVWLNGGMGVVRITTAELEHALQDRLHQPAFDLFDIEDGLPGIAQQVNPAPTAIEGPDGRLWFATNHGVAWIDPSRIRKNAVPPSVMIRAVAAGDVTYLPVPGLRLPERTQQIRIDYTATSLMRPERVRFRYRLDGVDADWREALGRREAFYTNLDPGSYRFQVIAANNDGVWNEAGAALDFTIAPTFWQSRWFLVFCGLVALAALWSLYALRLWRVTENMRAQLETRLSERQRIARELHDTLLQSTQGLTLRFQAIARRMAETDPARAMMEEALDRADQVIEEARDRVHDLRADHEEEDCLPDALQAVGQALAQDFPGTFRVIVHGAPRQAHPLIKEEAFQIGREALVNAVRHSGAANIEAEVSFDPDAFIVRLRDDGVGIDQKVLDSGIRAGHWGLPGMRERAVRIDGELNIWSRPGAGTEIELRVPAAVAYCEHARRHWWQWWRARAPVFSGQVGGGAVP